MEYIPYYDAYVLLGGRVDRPQKARPRETESASTDEDSGRIESARIGGSVGWNQDETEPVRVTLPPGMSSKGRPPSKLPSPTAVKLRNLLTARENWRKRWRQAGFGRG